MTHANLPAPFRRIRLELAREKGHPDGAAGIGYSLVAPLTRDGHLDTDLARDRREACTVVRFHEGRDSEEGFLHRRRDGAWSFHFDLSGGEVEEDATYRLASHRFAIGEYITVTEDDGPHTYCVTSVEAP